MTKVIVTIECRCDDELRDYIIDSIIMGIPCGSADRTDVKVDVEDITND